MAQNASLRVKKRAEKTPLSIPGPSGLETTLRKIFFFAPGTLVDPPLAAAVRGPRCPPAPPSDHWYGGLGVSFTSPPMGGF